MTNRKTTKKALIFSALSLLLCFSMLVGTTFAWFTDSVTSAGNIIQSGTLDVTMEWAEGSEAVPAVDSADWEDASKKPIFNNKLWEPGYTEVRHVKIQNEGTLALKYEIVIEPVGTVEELADVIDVYFVDPAAQVETRDDLANAKYVGTLTEVLANMKALTSASLEAGDNDTVTIALKMQETAGNEYQGKKIGDSFAIKLLATQMTYEEDSFDKNYDEDAFYYDALVATDAELLEAITDPKVKTIVIDGDLTYDWGGDSYENSKALLMKGKTLIGFDKDAAITFAGYGSANPIIGVTLKDITVKDVTVGDNEASWEHGYLEFENLNAKNVVFADSVMLNGDNNLNNCSMENTVSSWYGLWIGEGNTVMKDCSFSGTRAVKIHEAYNSDVASVTIDNCIFGALSEKPGVAIGTVNADTTITIKNSTFADVQEGDQGLYIYETDTDVTTFNFVEENNTIAKSVAVNSVDELATKLSGAGAAGAGNTVIRLNADMDLTNVAWTPIKVDGYHGADIVTIDGQGHTITGLSAPLFAGGFAGDSGIVIKNLTIADSNIVSTSGQGSGAFIECVDSMDVITLTNCHLKNSTVSGSRTGGLIGWTAGYNNVNDGPVKLYVTVENCSVVGCEINGSGSVGGVIGHSGGNAWTFTVIKDTVVKDCELNSTDAGGWRVGVVIGTVNVGEQNDIINVTSEGNTLTQTGKTAPAGQSDLYGRFVPGTTGKLTIDGVEIK